MMSISGLGMAGSGKAMYCQSQTSQEAKLEGYYQWQAGEPPGVWSGKGAAALGLHEGQKIDDATFQNVIAGKSPDGQDLVHGAGEKHRAGWDLTFSAPKSVSAAWAVSERDMQAKISAAHEIATQKAIELIEEKAAFARRGQGGAESEKLDGLIIGKYEHSTSRELDPDLHTHALVMNLAQRQDGTWGGIESRHIYEWQHAAGAVYRAELAQQMKDLGFTVEKDRQFFKIAGIDEKLCNEWSKRRNQIEQELAKKGLPTGNAKTSEIAGLSTRISKQEQDRESNFKRWQEEAKQHGFDSKYINDLATGKIQAEQENEQDEEPVLGEEYPENLYEHLTENESVFKEKDIYKTIAIRMQHEGKGADKVHAEVARAIASHQLVKLENGFYTTREMLKLETSALEKSRKLSSTKSNPIPEKNVQDAIEKFRETKGFSLSKEQQDSVRHITSDGQIKLVRGAAGAGKSTMAEAAKMAWEGQGMRVIGAALSGKAAAGLEEGSGIKSSTIHRLIFDIDEGNIKLSKNDVVVIDEAGMVGTKMMHNLLDKVEQAQAKIVLIGDERQLQAVSAGGAFRMLQKEFGYSELNEVRRQKNEMDRDAANNVATGSGRAALSAYLQNGRVEVGEDVVSSKIKLVDDYLKDSNHESEKMILAQRRADVFDLNNLARDRLGKTGTGHIIKTAHGEREFSAGDRILITKNDRELDIKNGNLGEIKDIRFTPQGELIFTVKLDNGKTIETQVSGKDGFKNIDHGYAVTVHKSQGATVNNAYFYTANFSEKELGYVAMSRHRDSCKLYVSQHNVEEELDRILDDDDPRPDGTEEALKKLGESLEKSREKVNALDKISHETAREIVESNEPESVINEPEMEM